MKRFGFVLTLFVIAFLFTKCTNSCGWGSGPGTEPSPIGFSSISSNFTGNSFLPTLEMQLEYRFAIKKPTFSIISSAYACDLAPGDFSLSSLIDSIKVVSKPLYNLIPLDQQLLLENNSRKNVKISDFNNFITRNSISSSTGNYILHLSSIPTQSDSFTFSFYYYKDGEIIDSSFTQKYYISNE